MDPSRTATMMITRHRRTSVLSPLTFTILILSTSAHAIHNASISLDHNQRSTSASPNIHTPRPRQGYTSHSSEDHDLVCRPFGECEPCPQDELDQPFCLPFGNRRLLHCLPASQAHDAGEGGDNRQAAGEIPAWEACGKVVRQERQDFWEFVTANLLFLIVALSILWARTSVLATAQYRQLAARIGIPSGSGSWRA